MALSHCVALCPLQPPSCEALTMAVAGTTEGLRSGRTTPSPVAPRWRGGKGRWVCVSQGPGIYVLVLIQAATLPLLGLGLFTLK